MTSNILFNRIKLQDVILAATLEIKTADTLALIEDTLEKLKVAVEETGLPEGIEYTDTAKDTIAEMIEVCRSHMVTFTT